MQQSYASFRVEPLHPRFGARVLGLDLSQPLSDTAHTELLAAFDDHSVLLFPSQSLDSAAQVQFSQTFGPLERAITRASTDGPGVHIANLSNVDEDGNLVAPDDRKQLFHSANRYWHTDSSYKPQTALASMLYAIEVPSEGGETEYVSTRAAFAELPEDRQKELAGLWAMHDFQRSRDLVAPNLVDKEVQQMLPPVRRPLVRTNPRNGERALYIASHATHIEGRTVEQSRPLLDELLDWCTRPECIYTHHWTAGDLVMWDNRCLLHFAVHDHADEPRVIHRLQVEGAVPV